MVLERLVSTSQLRSCGSGYEEKSTPVSRPTERRKLSYSLFDLGYQRQLGHVSGVRRKKLLRGPVEEVVNLKALRIMARRECEKYRRGKCEKWLFPSPPLPP